MRKRKVMELTPRMLESCRKYLTGEERDRATVERYLRDVRKFLEYPGDDGRVDKEKVQELKQELMGHYKVNSVNSMLATVSSPLGLVGRGDLEVKLLRVQKVVYSRPERRMTEKEHGGSVRTAKRLGDLRMGMLLQTISNMGIRINELKFIIVESPETGQAEIHNKGKSRIVLLPVELTRPLKKYCRKAGVYTGSIFVARQGNLLDRSNVGKKMKQLGREAGVDTAEVFPHNLRHLFARIFCSIEKDVARLMDLLGHSGTSTTRIYTMMTEEQPRRQMSRMKLVLG